MTTLTGSIKRVIADRGFGFIEAPGRGDVFFHCSALDGGLFIEDDQLPGRRVEFEVVQGDRGEMAAKVRPAVG